MQVLHSIKIRTERLSHFLSRVPEMQVLHSVKIQTEGLSKHMVSTWIIFFLIKTWTNSYISQYIIISVCSLAPENIFWLNLCLQTSCNKSSVHTHTTCCPHSHNVLSTLTQRIFHTHTMYSSPVTHYFAIYSPPSFKQHFKHTVSVHWTYPTMICDVKLKCRLPRYILPSICLECNVQVLKNLVSQFYIWDQWIKNV